MKITEARKEHSRDIARLIMQAMTDDCCQYMVGPDHTLADFERIMTRLVEMDESQYSYRNTLVALTDDGSVAGVGVAYDGGDLHRLREHFFRLMHEELGRDLRGIDDETSAGEYYLDSISVYPQYRRRGVASALIRALVERGHALGLAAGLLVDKANPNAERLYTALGFEYVNDTQWSGHEMRHLQWPPAE
ncbi:MAG: GNAT family N-acetyltransferase [Prevotella sp.]